jgi:hypothetical protein
MDISVVKPKIISVTQLKAEQEKSLQNVGGAVGYTEVLQGLPENAQLMLYEDKEVLVFDRDLVIDKNTKEFIDETKTYCVFKAPKIVFKGHTLTLKDLNLSIVASAEIVASNSEDKGIPSRIFLNCTDGKNGDDFPKTNGDNGGNGTDFDDSEKDGSDAKNNAKNGGDGGSGGNGGKGVNGNNGPFSSKTYATRGGFGGKGGDGSKGSDGGDGYSLDRIFISTPKVNNSVGKLEIKINFANGGKGGTGGKGGSGGKGGKGGNGQKNTFSRNMDSADGGKGGNGGKGGSGGNGGNASNSDKLVEVVFQGISKENGVISVDRTNKALGGVGGSVGEFGFGGSGGERGTGGDNTSKNGKGGENGGVGNAGLSGKNGL